MIVATLTPQYIAIVAVLAIVYFNRKKIPGMGKSVAQSLRRGKKQFDAHIDKVDGAAEIEATVVSEEDVTKAREQKRERDEV